MAVAVLGCLVLMVLWRNLQLVRTSIIGDPYPTTIFGLYPSPGTSPVPNVPGVAGSDYSQVYTSGLALRHGQSAYRPTDPAFADRFQRPPNYPPLTNWVFVPLTFLPYYSAVLVQIGLSLAVFVGAAALVLARAKLGQHVAPMLAAMLAFYFLTPIGVSHIERGQFDLLVAASYMLCTGCVLLPDAHPRMAILAGFLGALKWSSAPFLLCFSVFGFLFVSRRKRLELALIPLTLALSTLVFWRGLLDYWPSLQVYEFIIKPGGLTLQNFFPRWIGKVAPLVITAATAAVVVSVPAGIRRTQAFLAGSLPFALALVNVGTCFGSISYEYRTVSILGMLPGLILWTERAQAASNHVKCFTWICWGLFALIAFRVLGLGAGQHVTFGSEAMTLVYLGFALVFLATSYSAILTAGQQRPLPPPPSIRKT